MNNIISILNPQQVVVVDKDVVMNNKMMCVDKVNDQIGYRLPILIKLIYQGVVLTKPKIRNKPINVCKNGYHVKNGWIVIYFGLDLDKKSNNARKGYCAK
jgi:hypoxanthine-guanine phosphoribosyltransferase